MKVKEHFAWFLFKMAFQVFFTLLMWSFIALLNEDMAVQGWADLIEEIKQEFKDEGNS